MENTKRKKIKRLFIVCIVILVILIIVMALLQKKSHKIRNVGSIEITKTEKSVSIENFDDVLNKLPMKSVTMLEKVQDFALEYIKKIYQLKDASEKEIEAYYEENTEEIKNFLYQADLESFEAFVQQLKQMNSQTLTYTKNIFQKETFQSSDQEASFVMKITYEKEDDLSFKVHVIKGEDGIAQENEIWFAPIK